MHLVESKPPFHKKCLPLVVPHCNCRVYASACKSYSAIYCYMFCDITPVEWLQYKDYLLPLKGTQRTFSGDRKHCTAVTNLYFM